MEVTVEAIGLTNSLEWSLKCNSDDDVMAETLLGLFTRLSPMEGGWGGGGCDYFSLTIYKLLLKRISNVRK